MMMTIAFCAFLYLGYFILKHTLRTAISLVRERRTSAKVEPKPSASTVREDCPIKWTPTDEEKRISSFRENPLAFWLNPDWEAAREAKVPFWMVEPAPLPYKIEKKKGVEFSPDERFSPDEKMTIAFLLEIFKNINHTTLDTRTIGGHILDQGVIVHDDDRTIHTSSRIYNHALRLHNKQRHSE